VSSSFVFFFYIHFDINILIMIKLKMYSNKLWLNEMFSDMFGKEIINKDTFVHEFIHPLMYKIMENSEKIARIFW